MEMTQVKLQLKLNQTKAMSVLSACDSKIDMMNLKKDLESPRGSRKSHEDSNVLSPVKIGNTYSDDEAKSERA